MKYPNIKKPLQGRLLICLVAGLTVLFSPVGVFSGAEGVLSRVKTSTLKMDSRQQVKTSIPIPKNTVEVKARFQGGKFFTLTRKNEIKRFKCSACHNDKAALINNAAAVTHGDITVDHGEKDRPLACNTCHNEHQRDYLRTSKTEKIDMDHVYQLCGECHFRQKKDWIGGAHGKRVTYWAGERVVSNCTSCHNPHSPKFEKRWPKTYSVPLK